jgi:hypothetical protein
LNISLNGRIFTEIYKTVAHHSSKIRDPKLLTGSLSNKYAVVLDGGKTIIYISDKSKEAETRARYEQRKRA